MTPSESTVSETERQSATGWVAASALRVAFALVGFVLLLAAIGQLSGFDLIGLVADGLQTSIGLWIVVALVAIVLLAVGIRGFNS